MEPSTTFTITNDLKVVFTNFQLETKVYLVNRNDGNFTCLDVDKWTEFSKAFNSIEKEFYKRFKHQQSNL